MAKMCRDSQLAVLKKYQLSCTSLGILKYKQQVGLFFVQSLWIEVLLDSGHPAKDSGSALGMHPPLAAPHATGVGLTFSRSGYCWFHGGGHQCRSLFIFSSLHSDTQWACISLWLGWDHVNDLG